MQFHIVIATFNRADYLAPLLESIRVMDPAPSRVIVVDNASTDSTVDVITAAEAASPVPLIHHRMSENSGGSGAFSAGVERALAEGADWLWLMDDDVEVIPDALASFEKWMLRYDCITGRRYDSNGNPFFWQNRFNSFLGLNWPVFGDVFAHTDAFVTNAGCFEGMAVKADVVRQVGLPDPRFFLTWDDAVYGWLVSLNHQAAYVNEFVLKKTRAQRQVDLGLRHLNDSSNLSRYYVMRNRGYVAQYIRHFGSFNGAGFALGTVLTAGKEVLRLIAVERTLKGSGALWRGWRDSRALLQETDWQPMPALQDTQER